MQHSFVGWDSSKQTATMGFSIEDCTSLNWRHSTVIAGVGWVGWVGGKDDRFSAKRLKHSVNN